MSDDIIPANDQTHARREHLERIRELVGNAYPNKFRRTNVAASEEGEDTITALADHETLTRIVNDDAFETAFTLLVSKVKAGERPAPEDLAPLNSELNKINVRVAGRIATPPRVMGKAAFVHLSDGKERLQIYIRKQDVKAINNDTGQPVDDFDSGWQLLQYLDHGDFLGVEGELFLTKTGELSVHVREMQFLSKALVPMPDKMHGIADPEIRQRQRYADLIASSLKIEREEGELSTREVFERRSKLIREMRRHLDAHGYIEVETPMLTPIASGAAARPFETYHNALDIKLYARIAPELYLKRLLVGGFERVYELNRNFRNEGISTRHNPEFTMLEFYTAYQDVNWMMDFCEEMLRQSVIKAMGQTTVNFSDATLDFGNKFRRLTMREAIAEYWPEEIRSLSGDVIGIPNFCDPVQIDCANWFLLELERKRNEHLEDHRNSALEKYRQSKWIATPEFSLGESEEEYVAGQLEYARGDFTENQKDGLWDQAKKRAISLWKDDLPSADQTARQIVEMFEALAEENLIQPTFIIDFPKPVSPLSKASPEDPTIAERFELYVAGMEIANGFSELNDPVEQHQRFQEQAEQRERGDDEAMQTDMDYVRALSYGMPPAAGIGIGIDRLTMLLTNRRSIRDVILFPHMRPRREAEGEPPPDAEAIDDNNAPQ